MDSQDENVTTFDRRAALGMAAGDPRGLAELVELLVEFCPPVIRQLEDAVANRNAEQIQQFAHRVKGTVSTFHARAAYETAFELEQAGANVQLCESDTLLDRLRSEVDQLIAELSDYVQELSE